KDRYSFSDATAICANLVLKYTNYGNKYSRLAQVDNLFDWSFLTTAALESNYDDFFIGIRYRKSVGFERIDELLIRFAPWGIGEPNLRNGDCVVVRIGTNGPAWYMDDCMKKKPLVCQLSKDKFMSARSQIKRCPDGKEDWILGETHCYHLVDNESMLSSGYNADQSCIKVS
ncbi:unnamed protein product, partial [Thelazia callipaeda]|uniref:C-type lectin domain-containing protein n=1 Tax=Thelazia callipaeda TaxID=103827 RepID=A0A0N5D3Q8_THECL